MSTDVETAMRTQSEQRKQLEALLAAAHKSAMETGGLPADSSDPRELCELTLGTIAHSERIARAYSRAAIQAAVVARSSLEVAKAVARELPAISPDEENAMRRADDIVSRLESEFDIAAPVRT